MPSPTAPGRQGHAAQPRAVRLSCAHSAHTHLLHLGVCTEILHLKTFVLRPGGGRAQGRVPAVPAQGRPLRGGRWGGFGAQRPYVCECVCMRGDVSLCSRPRAFLTGFNAGLKKYCGLLWLFFCLFVFSFYFFPSPVDCFGNKRSCMRISPVTVWREVLLLHICPCCKQTSVSLTWERGRRCGHKEVCCGHLSLAGSLPSAGRKL